MSYGGYCCRLAGDEKSERPVRGVDWQGAIRAYILQLAMGARLRGHSLPDMIRIEIRDELGNDAWKLWNFVTASDLLTLVDSRLEID